MDNPKPTSCKEAILRWEENNKKPAAEAKEVILSFQFPPIEKMDNSLATLIKVEKLSLSTNMIEKIAGINALKNLKILSLSRNNIKTFSGLEAVGETLEELWISYNMIEKIKGVTALKALKVLYMSHNVVKDWGEINRLADIPNLNELILVGNPVYDNSELKEYRSKILKKMPQLYKLDSIVVLKDEHGNVIEED